MKTLIQNLLLIGLLAAPLAAQSSWEVSAGPGAISEHTMVRDSVDDRLIVFGGTLNGALSNRTFAYLPESRTWQELATVGTAPSPRREALAVFDAVRDRMIVFGGTSATGYTNDTFALEFSHDAPEWVPLAVERVLPQPRTHGVMVIDTANDRLILHGGYNSPTLLKDVWALSLTEGAESWGGAPLLESSPGIATIGDAAIYDPDGRRMIVYRAYDGSLYSLSLDDDLTWSFLAAAPAALGGRRYPAVAYDSLRHEMILQGGLQGTQVLNDAWSLDIDNLAWTPLAAEAGSAGRFWHAAAYDEVRDRYYMVGGCDAARVQNDSMAELQAPIGTPEPLSPIDGTLVEDESFALEWAPAKGATDYFVTVYPEDGLANYESCEITISGTSAAVTLKETPVSGGSTKPYIWVVVAYNMAGVCETIPQAEFRHVIPDATLLSSDVSAAGTNEKALPMNNVLVGSTQVQLESGQAQQLAALDGADEQASNNNAAGCVSGNAGSGLALTLLALLGIAIGLRKARKPSRE